MPTQKQIERALTESLDTLLARDDHLLGVDANERSLTHRLAVYLEHAVNAWQEDWNVDCEYNRDVMSEHERYIKQLDLHEMDLIPVQIDDEHARTVYPDIIVHNRGTDQNLLVIETKKNSSDDDGSHDRKRKLPAYKIQLGYQYAVFVLLAVGENIGYDYEWIE